MHRAAIFRTLGPVYFYFLVAGAVTVMLGPLLPLLIHRWHIQDAQAGTLFTASFVGQFCGAWISARNLRASLLYGSIVSAAGCLALVWLGFGASHIALFLLGVGLGTGLTAGNILAGTTIPSARARLLAALNVAWGIGAIACPILIRTTAAGGIRGFFFAIALLLVLASLLSIAIPASANSTGAPGADSRLTGFKHKHSRLPLRPVPLVTFAAGLFLYVGVENSLGGWLPTYAFRTVPSLHASSISLDFWTAELVGRLLLAGLMTPPREAVLYRVCLFLLIVTEASLCGLAHPSAHGILALTVVAELALAPLYPLLVSSMLGRTGNHKRLGGLFASASIGGAVLPWLTGLSSTHFGQLRAGLVVPATGAALLLLFSAVVTAKPRSALQVDA